MCMYVCMYVERGIYIYMCVCMYIYRERERERVIIKRHNYLSVYI